MSLPLLATKLRVPPSRSRHVPRPRLVDALERGIAGKLTLVSAPAGYGKTTALGEWAQRSGRPVAWLTVDEADNEPGRFWAHLVAGLAPILQGVAPDSSGLLHTLAGQSGESVVTVLINAMMEARHPFVIVLEDYHHVTTQQVHGPLAYLLEHLPEPAHMVISGRADPPLPLARLRARNQLTELRAAALAFTAEETERIVAQAPDLALTADQVGLLHTRTEGWVVGLQLALMAMQGRSDVQRFLGRFSGGHRHVVDFLADEVLQRLPEHTQRFLLQTCVLERLSGALCDAVTQGSAGHATLAALEQDNVFLIPLDEERRWYRYHRLFAEALCEMLQRRDPGVIAELHARAADWYEANGLQVDAVGHALAAGAPERAAALVEAVGETALARGEVLRLAAWFDRLDEDLLRARPRLAALRAAALVMSGKARAAERAVRELGETVPSGVESIALSVETALAASRGDWAGTMAAVQRVRDLAGDEADFARSMAAYCTWMAFTRSQTAVAVSQVVTELAGTGGSGGLSRLVADAAAGKLYAHQGDLHRAAEVFRRAISAAAGAGADAPAAVGLAVAGLADIQREWNDLAQAGASIRDGLALCRRTGSPDALTDACAILARIRLSEGDAPSALEALRQAELEARRQELPGHHPATLAAYRASIWIQQGNLRAAAHWAEESGMAEEADLPAGAPTFVRELQQLVYARLLIAWRRLDQALPLLDRVLRAAEAAGRTQSVIEALKLSAVALHLRGDQPRATATLERALLIAEPEGYVRIFADEGPALAGILTAVVEANQQRRVAGRHSLAMTYLRKVLKATGQTPAPPASMLGEAAPPDQSAQAVEPLSEREVEILSLIHAGLSNQEIALRLFLTVSTVKWHIHNIYGKLGVRSRTQAVAWARALKVLSP